MNGNSQSNTKTNYKTNSRNKNRNNRNRKSNKKMEFNVPDSSINVENLKGIKFTSPDNGGNDIAWYTNIAPLLESVGRIPFTLAEGSPYNPIDSRVTALNPPKSDNEQLLWPKAPRRNYLPGIMRFDIIPTYGNSEDHTSALNVSSLETFTMLRNAVSGRMSYDQNDVGLEIVAMDSAYMLYQYLVRVYQAIFTVDYNNKYLPEMLLRAMDVSPDIRNYASELEAAINYFVTQLARINIPDQFDILHRHAWLFSNVYKDADSSKAQLYLFMPIGFYRWMEGDEAANEPNYVAFESKWDTFGKSKPYKYLIETIEDVYFAIDRIMKRILGSEAFGQINGQMANAFGQDKMVKVSYVDAKQPLLIAYNREVMSEIENAVVLSSGETVQVSGLNITQVQSDLVSGPYLFTRPSINQESGATSLAENGRGAYKVFINMHQPSVTIQDVAVATRFAVAIGSQYTQDEKQYYSLTCGSEIVMRARTYQFTPDSNGLGHLSWTGIDIPSGFRISTSNSGITFTIDKTFISALSAWSQFDWAPSLILTSQNVDDGGHPGVANFMDIICDVDNYAWIESEDLEAIHNACIMSLMVNKDYRTNDR